MLGVFSRLFSQTEGGSVLGKVTFTVSNNVYNGYYNLTAAENEKTPIKLDGKSIYSDVYVFKEDEKGNL